MITLYKIGFTFGLLAFFIFIIGHAGLIASPYILLAVLLACFFFLYFLKQGYPFSASSKPRIKTTSSSGSSYISYMLIAVTALFLLATLALALTPPTVRDELIHHLAIPKLYIEQGKIFEIPAMGFSYYPMNLDLLYLIPLAFKNDILPRLLHFLFSILTATAIYLYLKPKTGRIYALTGFLLFISTPLVLNLSRMAYVDLGLTFYTTLALLGVLKWQDEDWDKRWLVYSAISLGLALGCKYNVLIVFFLISALVIYIYSHDTKDQLTALKLGGMYILIVLLVFSPWLIRNTFWTGSPLYPIYKNVLNTSSRGEGIHIMGSLSPMVKRSLLYGESTLDIILVPLRIFWEGRDNSIERFDGVLNPFFLPFIFVGIISRFSRSRNIRYLAIFSILYFYMVFFTVDLATRYMLPALPPLIIIIVWGIKYSLENKTLKWPTVLLVGSLFIFNVIYTFGLYQRYNPLAYLRGNETREDYLMRVLPDYPVTSFANNNLSNNSKVMFLFAGERGYYWDRKYYYGGRTGGKLIKYLKESQTSSDLKERFTEKGITHLFVKDSLLQKFAMDNFNQREMELMSGLFRENLFSLYEANGFSIYEIR